jgi:hypothetical protein
MTQATQSDYVFTLILDGISDLTPDVMDAIYEAGFDDALLGISEGVPYLDLEREATSAREAVVGAVIQVHQASKGIRVIRVEPENFVPDAELQRYCDSLAAPSAS